MEIRYHHSTFWVFPDHSVTHSTIPFVPLCSTTDTHYDVVRLRLPPVIVYVTFLFYWYHHFLPDYGDRPLPLFIHCWYSWCDLLMFIPFLTRRWLICSDYILHFYIVDVPSYHSHSDHYTFVIHHSTDTVSWYSFGVAVFWAIPSTFLMPVMLLSLRPDTLFLDHCSDTYLYIYSTDDTIFDTLHSPHFVHSFGDVPLRPFYHHHHSVLPISFHSYVTPLMTVGTITFCSTIRYRYHTTAVHSRYRYRWSFLHSWYIWCLFDIHSIRPTLPFHSFHWHYIRPFWWYIWWYIRWSRCYITRHFIPISISISVIHWCYIHSDWLVIPPFLIDGSRWCIFVRRSYRYLPVRVTTYYLISCISYRCSADSMLPDVPSFATITALRYIPHSFYCYRYLFLYDSLFGDVVTIRYPAWFYHFVGSDTIHSLTFCLFYNSMQFALEYDTMGVTILRWLTICDDVHFDDAYRYRWNYILFVYGDTTCFIYSVVDISISISGILDPHSRAVHLLFCWYDVDRYIWWSVQFYRDTLFYRWWYISVHRYIWYHHHVVHHSTFYLEEIPFYISHSGGIPHFPHFCSFIDAIHLFVLWYLFVDAILHSPFCSTYCSFVLFYKFIPFPHWYIDRALPILWLIYYIRYTILFLFPHCWKCLTILTLFVRYICSPPHVVLCDTTIFDPVDTGDYWHSVSIHSFLHHSSTLFGRYSHLLTVFIPVDWYSTMSFSVPFVEAIHFLRTSDAFYHVTTFHSVHDTIRWCSIYYRYSILPLLWYHSVILFVFDDDHSLRWFLHCSFHSIISHLMMLFIRYLYWWYSFPFIPTILCLHSVGGHLHSTFWHCLRYIFIRYIRYIHIHIHSYVVTFTFGDTPIHLFTFVYSFYHGMHTVFGIYFPTIYIDIVRLFNAFPLLMMFIRCSIPVLFIPFHSPPDGNSFIPTIRYILLLLMFIR